MIWLELGNALIEFRYDFRLLYSDFDHLLVFWLLNNYLPLPCRQKSLSHSKITWVWSLISKLALNEDPPQSNNIYIYPKIVRITTIMNENMENPQIIKFEYFALISFNIFAQIRHFKLFKVYFDSLKSACTSLF